MSLLSECKSLLSLQLGLKKIVESVGGCAVMSYASSHQLDLQHCTQKELGRIQFPSKKMRSLDVDLKMGLDTYQIRLAV